MKTVLILLFVLGMLMNPVSGQESIVILDSSDVSTMLENVRYIESLGGTVTLEKHAGGGIRTHEFLRK